MRQFTRPQTSDATDACDAPATPGRSGGWKFAAGGAALFSAKTSDKAKGGDPALGPDNADVYFDIKAKGIVNDVGPVTGTGLLRILVRETRNDPVGGDMTVVDYPYQFAVSAAGGAIKSRTSLNAIKALLGQAPLPRPPVLQILTVELLDSNEDVFAAPSLGLQ